MLVQLLTMAILVTGARGDVVVIAQGARCPHRADHGVPVGRMVTDDPELCRRIEAIFEANCHATLPPGKHFGWLATGTRAVVMAEIPPGRYSQKGKWVCVFALTGANAGRLVYLHDLRPDDKVGKIDLPAKPETEWTRPYPEPADHKERRLAELDKWDRECRSALEKERLAALRHRRDPEPTAEKPSPFASMPYRSFRPR